MITFTALVAFAITFWPMWVWLPLVVLYGLVVAAIIWNEIK